MDKVEVRRLFPHENTRNTLPFPIFDRSFSLRGGLIRSAEVWGPRMTRMVGVAVESCTHKVVPRTTYLKY